MPEIPGSRGGIRRRVESAAPQGRPATAADFGTGQGADAAARAVVTAQEAGEAIFDASMTSRVNRAAADLTTELNQAAQEIEQHPEHSERERLYEERATEIEQRYRGQIKFGRYQDEFDVKVAPRIERGRISVADSVRRSQIDEALANTRALADANLEAIANETDPDFAAWLQQETHAAIDAQVGAGLITRVQAHAMKKGFDAQVDERELLRDSHAIADELISSFPGQLAKQVASARRTLKGNPELLEMVEARLSSNHRIEDEIRKDADAAEVADLQLRTLLPVGAEGRPTELEIIQRQKQRIAAGTPWPPGVVDDLLERVEGSNEDRYPRLQQELIRWQALTPSQQSKTRPWEFFRDDTGRPTIPPEKIAALDLARRNIEQKTPTGQSRAAYLKTKTTPGNTPQGQAAAKLLEDLGEEGVEKVLAALELEAEAYETLHKHPMPAGGPDGYQQRFRALVSEVMLYDRWGWSNVVATRGELSLGMPGMEDLPEYERRKAMVRQKLEEANVLPQDEAEAADLVERSTAASYATRPMNEDWAGFPTSHPYVENEDGTRSNVVLEHSRVRNRAGQVVWIAYPTMVEGKQLTSEQARAIVREKTNKGELLEQFYPVFETELAARNWVSAFHGAIGPDGQLRAGAWAAIHAGQRQSWSNAMGEVQ